MVLLELLSLSQNYWLLFYTLVKCNSINSYSLFENYLGNALAVALVVATTHNSHSSKSEAVN